MSITLVSGATTITLPEDMQWADEFTTWQVSRIDEFSLTGALIRHESAKLAGRPITLQSGPNFSWVPRSTVEALRTLEATANGANMTLSLHDYPSGFRTFTVRFRGGESAIESAQIKHRTPPAPDDWYSLVLRLTQVA